MNTAKYYSPRRADRKEVTLERFCKDCSKNKNKCGKKVKQCIKEATVYKNFARINTKRL